MVQPGAQRTTVARPIVWKGRAAVSNLESRFSRLRHLREDQPDPSGKPDTDADAAEPARAPATEVRVEVARSVLSTNNSPDVPFDRSVNPYRGCEHGCVYCYARPTHTYLGLSAGLDFETKLFAKTNAAELLRQELSRPGYMPAPLGLGANTDPYQPAERDLSITRGVLEVLRDFDHPVIITTKSALVTRDIDILAPMAAKGLVTVMISVATLDADIARTMEPRANTPERRLRAISQLSAAGIPTGVLVAPVVPALTDQDLERVLEAAAAAGARTAGFTILRLPLEVADLVTQWLQVHYPQRASHVMSLVRQMRGGRNNDPSFGTRMRGNGPIADLIARRFQIACKRLGLNARDEAPADPAARKPRPARPASVVPKPKPAPLPPSAPPAPEPQLSLF